MTSNTAASPTRTLIFVVPSQACEYIGIELLATILRQRCRLTVVVAAGEAELLGRLRNAPDAFVGFSVYSAYAADCILTAQRLKRRFPHAQCLCGGPHATFCPEELVTAEGIDAVCVGEAEDAAVDFFTAYDWHNRRPATAVANWWIKINGTVYRNEPRPPRQDLDNLPLPDMTLFNRSALYRRGVRRFMLSRGCLLHCRYCSCPGLAAVYEQSPAEFYRCTGVAAAIRNIQQALRHFGGRALGFVDSIFGVQSAWLEEFSPAYRRAVGLPFYCNTEAGVVTAAYARRLRQAGCVFTYLGLETAADHTRRTILGKQFTTAQLHAAVRLLREQHIEIGLYNIIGIPGGTLNEDLDTLRANQQLAPAIADVKVFSFYPGTALYQHYQQQGALAQPLPVRHAVYWAVLNTPALRPDLSQLIRLQYLFGIFAACRTPRRLVRLILRLPLSWLYRLIAFGMLRVVQRDYNRLCALFDRPSQRKEAAHE